MQPTSKPSISRELVDTARQTLEAIPPPPKAARLLTVKDAIRALSPTIRKLLQRGYSREQVVALLREQGIDCSLTTLKSNYRVKPRMAKASSTSTGTKTTASTDAKTAASTLPASSAAAIAAAPLTPRVTSPTEPWSATVTGTPVQRSDGPGSTVRPTPQATKVP